MLQVLCCSSTASCSAGLVSLTCPNKEHWHVHPSLSLYRVAVKVMPKRFGPDGFLERQFARRVRNEVDIASHLGRRCVCVRVRVRSCSRAGLVGVQPDCTWVWEQGVHWHLRLRRAPQGQVACMHRLHRLMRRAGFSPAAVRCNACPSLPTPRIPSRRNPMQLVWFQTAPCLQPQRLLLPRSI